MENNIQVRLFDAIIKKFKNRSKALADYEKNFPGTGSSTARARFNGTTAITYTHGMQVAAHYNLHDLDVWKEGWSETQFMVKVPALTPDMDAYLDMLIKDLEWVKKQPNAQIHLAIHEMPFILLKKHRYIAGFLLYFSLCIESNHPKFSHYTFGTAFLQDPQIVVWLDRCREALALYQQIPGVEYWCPRMLQGIKQKIKLIQNADLYENTDMPTTLCFELNRLIDDLEQKVKIGKKILGPEQQGAAVRILSHDGFITNTHMVAESSESGVLFSYEERGILHVLRYEAAVAQLQLDKIERSSNWGKGINSRFFVQMRQYNEA
jgi:hypothetical protein